MGISYILRYANKIKKNPQSSPVYKEDEYWRKRGGVNLDEIDKTKPLAAWLVYGFLSLAFCGGLMYLLQERELKSKKFFRTSDGIFCWQTIT